MKKVIKRVLLVLAIVVVALICVAAYNFYPLLTMSPTETGHIDDTQIYAVKNNVGTLYFVDTGAGYIMVDAGSNAENLEKSLKEAGIGADEVKWIFLTHSDTDHVAGLALFPDAEIYMSEDEIGLIDKTIPRSGSSFNKLPSVINTEDVKQLKDEEELLLGGSAVKCIKAPGHTNGSMLYLVDGKYLFTGDAFRISGGAMDIHPFTMDKAGAVYTIVEISEIVKSSELVLTSHYGCLK
jgi:glyoxylase-like metal-dependent hydrolase (beta-lactamase superfamily II)